jgi:hypothetical protein
LNGQYVLTRFACGLKVFEEFSCLGQDLQRIDQFLARVAEDLPFNGQFLLIGGHPLGEFACLEQLFDLHLKAVAFPQPLLLLGSQLRCLGRRGGPRFRPDRPAVRKEKDEDDPARKRPGKHGLLHPKVHV